MISLTGIMSCSIPHILFGIRHHVMSLFEYKAAVATDIHSADDAIEFTFSAFPNISHSLLN